MEEFSYYPTDTDDPFIAPYHWLLSPSTSSPQPILLDYSLHNSPHKANTCTLKHYDAKQLQQFIMGGYHNYEDDYSPYLSLQSIKHTKYKFRQFETICNKITANHYNKVLQTDFEQFKTSNMFAVVCLLERDKKMTDEEKRKVMTRLKIV